MKKLLCLPLVLVLLNCQNNAILEDADQRTASFLNGTSTTGLVVSENLTAWWKFDGNSTESVSNISPDGPAATFAHAQADRFGATGSSAQFGSSSETYTGSVPTAVVGGNNHTFSFWFFMKTNGTFTRFLERLNGGTSGYIVKDPSGNRQIEAFIEGNGSSDAAGITNIGSWSDGVWNFVTITYTANGANTDINIYLATAGSTTATLTKSHTSAATNWGDSSSVFMVGGGAGTGFEWYLDDLLVYNRALTAEEISRNLVATQR